MRTYKVMYRPYGRSRKLRTVSIKCGSAMSARSILLNFNPKAKVVAIW